MIRKMSLVAVVGFMTAVGFGMWTSSPAKTPVGPAAIEPMKFMIGATGLVTDEYADYSLVFNLKSP